MVSEWREVLSRRRRTSKTKRFYEDDQPTNKYSWNSVTKEGQEWQNNREARFLRIIVFGVVF